MWQDHFNSTGVHVCVCVCICVSYLYMVCTYYAHIRIQYVPTGVFGICTLCVSVLIHIHSHNPRL